MGRIGDEDIQRVRDATDVVSLIGERIVLKPKGRLYWGLCPFHGEKTPSFKVDPATQLFYCFGCGKAGDAFKFVQYTDNVDFPDAVRMLAERARIDIVEAEGGVPRGHKERLFAACEEAASFYHRVLTGSRDAGATNARAYLKGRGLGSTTAKDWNLGFAPGRGALVKHLTAKGFKADELVDANLALRSDGGTLKDRFYERVMFPISDLNGRVIAFGGRVMGKGEPKYLNTNDTPVFHKKANLYGIDRAKATIVSTGVAIVVEGYTDVIALHNAGITNAVATLGTALNKQHVKLLSRFAKKVVYLFDGDEAGMNAADKAAAFIDRDITPEAGGSRVDLSVAVIPDGLDPADFVATKGAAGMREVVDTAQPLLQFAIDRRLARWDLERPEERSRALKEAAEVLAPIKDSLLADDYANYIADRLFADFNTVKRAVASSVVASASREDDEAVVETAPGIGPAVTPRQRVERELLALLVRTPGLRGEARKLLEANLLSDPHHKAMATAIVTAGEHASPSAVAGSIELKVPGASQAIAAVMLELDGEPQKVADGLALRLKEYELERRIAVGKTQLKRPESFKDAAEYDELYREVSALQRELDVLRRGTE